jgi:hypothetical protein
MPKYAATLSGEGGQLESRARAQGNH